MSAIGTIIGKVDNCGGNQANTGKEGCLQLFGTPLSVILTAKNFSIPATTEITIAYLQLQVQNGNLIPVMEASSFEDLSSEDTMSTNAAVVERINLLGLPKYKFMYEEGHEFYKQMSKLTSFKSRGVILIDDAGRWLFGRKADGSLCGMTAGQINPEQRKTKVQGGDAESKSLTIQFLDRLQWDYEYGIVEREAMGLSESDVPVINGVNLAFTATPGDTDTSLEISAKLSSDNTSLIEGLETANFFVTINGVTEAGFTANEATPGMYTLSAITALATSDVVVVGFISGNYTTIISGDELYRTAGVTATV